MTPVTERAPCPPYSGLNAVGVATTVGVTPAMSGRGTMGLLMSDTLLIDPTLDETMRLLDNLSELACANDAARESYEDDGADPLV